MFIIIPAIIIFLASSYLYLNDVSLLVQVLIYLFIVMIILFSLYIYIAIQKNLKQQEKNKIVIEINQLKQRIKNEDSENKKKILYRKIEKLYNNLV